ncbi:MAG TPA: EAL domain-containing protein [Gaiellaceae bacterium]|nr:EAL domain-containing protein [Gaiellaceae bacterium]
MPRFHVEPPAEAPGRGGPPRLVLRFAVWTAIALALAAGAILLVIRHFDTVQAERAANSQARVIASAALSARLRMADFERPVTGPRRSTLDGIFERHVLAEGVLLVKLYTRDGTVTYSNDHRLIGTRTGDPRHLREARQGSIRGDVTSIADGRKALRTYAPVAVRGGTGVVAIYQDYGPIAAAARSTFVPVAGIFEAALVLLFVSLVPLLRRVAKRIRRQMDEIERRALYDETTGLPNRTLFRDRIGQALRSARREQSSAAVLLLDIDRFKEINDALGHDTGDLLLKAVGDRLAEQLRESDTLARLGGDEFGILLPKATVDEAQQAAGRVHAALEASFALRELPLEVAASIGVVAYPQHGNDADTLLKHADVAMYIAKDAQDETAVYDAEQDTNDADRLALAGELRRGIEGGELVVHYQPKADLESGSIVGAEALVRWEHPERGLVPPNDFISVAERTGLIKPLSRYVLAEAIRQCSAWNAAGLELHVAVNLTIPDLLDLELPDRIAELLEEHGVGADQLELEITESTILADPFRVRGVLTRLNEMGLRLAIDDFGTGYSSLAYLKRLPVQTIKIDRSFVMDMCNDASDATIVRSTIDLGRNLGLAIVAEGVESQEIWDALREQGCSLAQGYFIGKPTSPDALAAQVEERAAPPVKKRVKAGSRRS